MCVRAVFAVCVPTLLQCIGLPLSMSAGLCEWTPLDYLYWGSVDKKSSLLPQIRRLNAALRVSAAPRANGSESTTLRELWHNPPVTVMPQDNAWAMWLLFKYYCMSLAFKYIRVIQGLWGVLLTWYLNWKVNPDATTDDSRLQQPVMQREISITQKWGRQQSLHLPSLFTCSRSIMWHCLCHWHFRSCLSAL